MPRFLWFAAGLAAGISVATSQMGDLYCYAPYSTAVMPEYQATYATVKVNWQDGPRGGTAYAEFEYDPNTQTADCELWIRMPEQILGDPDMDGIGHEALHCFAGMFHKEDE